METESVKPTWTESIKQTFNNWNISSGFIVEILGYLLVGFVFGFILKNFGRLILSILIGSILAIWLLEMFNIITINYSNLESIVGITSQTSVGNILSFIFNWIKSNIAQFIAFLLGLYISLELT